MGTLSFVESNSPQSMVPFCLRFRCRYTPAHLLYLNGKKVKSQATKGNRLFHQNGKHNAYVLGANAENNGFSIPYNGLVDEIRVYDKVLKGNAVKESMQELSIGLTDQLLVLSTN